MNCNANSFSNQREKGFDEKMESLVTREPTHFSSSLGFNIDAKIDWSVEYLLDDYATYFLTALSVIPNCFKLKPNLLEDDEIVADIYETAAKIANKILCHKLKEATT